MIKLVSQFDSEKMRASVATPTCGPCCSCCCCCIVSTLATSIVTSRNFGKIYEKTHNGLIIDGDNRANPESSIDNKRGKIRTMIAGFFMPIVLIIVAISLSAIFRGEDDANIGKAIVIFVGFFVAIWGRNCENKAFVKKILLTLLITMVIIAGLLVGEAYLWIKFIFN